MPGYGTRSVRAWRPVRRLFRPLPALRLLQPPRPEPGQLHEFLPLELRRQAGGRKSGRRRLSDRGSHPPRPVDAHRGRRARHLHPQLERPARHRIHRPPDGDRHRFTEDRGAHQVGLLCRAHLPGLPAGHRRCRGRPAIRCRSGDETRRSGQPGLHGRFLRPPSGSGLPELPERPVANGQEPVCRRRARLRGGRLGGDRSEEPLRRRRPSRTHPSGRQQHSAGRAHAESRRWRDGAVEPTSPRGTATACACPCRRARQARFSPAWPTSRPLLEKGDGGMGAILAATRLSGRPAVRSPLRWSRRCGCARSARPT